MSFKLGDKVKLKYGGPGMTVIDLLNFDTSLEGTTNTLSIYLVRFLHASFLLNNANPFTWYR